MARSFYWFLMVSKRRFRNPSTDAWHSPRARILLGFPCLACVPHAALEGPYLLLFLAVSKRRFRHPSTDARHSPRARILLGFPCFACVPHGALEGTSHSCRNEQYCILTSIHVSIAAKANKDKKSKTRHACVASKYPHIVEQDDARFGHDSCSLRNLLPTT